MNRAVVCGIGLFMATVSYAANGDKASPYSGQQYREIKALSAEDIESYLAGKGMGLAKAAELNGYPGPSHVLSLADELALSPDQKDRTEAVFKTMEAKAKEIGRILVDEERRLDQLFASKSITPEGLSVSLRRIGELQAQVREAHLEAHLAQVEILTPVQIASYMKLRGYGDITQQHRHPAHGHGANNSL